MKNTLPLRGIFFLFLLIGSFSAAAQGQPTPRPQKLIVLQATKAARSQGGANPHITADMPTEDVLKPRSRGETCQMAFVNHTGYHVKIYINGTFNSAIGPWGKSAVLVDGLAPIIYCKTSGGTLEWNGGGECDMGFENVFDLRP